MQCLVKYFIQEEEAPCPLKYDEAMLEEEEDEKDFVLLTSIISEVYIYNIYGNARVWKYVFMFMLITLA